MNDPVTQALVGHSIWYAALWIETHCGEDAYEIFSSGGDTDPHGYRIVVERIDYREPPAPEPDMDRPPWDAELNE